jgi:hypothetical protein
MPFSPLPPFSTFTNKVLILPTVAVGNVAQLAADVLLCNTQHVKVGYFHDPSLMSFAGNDPLATDRKECRGNLVRG